jgi:DNA-binding LytR/AlgR family response regulator
MTVVIIEDEIPAAKRLEKLLFERGFATLIILNSVTDSINWFKNNNQPDLVFMDIKLRDNLVFKVFDKVEIKSTIVFTTALEDYALKAFNYNSIDYLLKPIDEKKLDKLVDKIDQFKSGIFLNEGIQNSYVPEFSNFKTSFLVLVGNSLKKIVVNDIVSFYSEHNSTYIVTNVNRRFPINHSLEKLETLICPNQFFRISRKHIINKNFIKEIVEAKIVVEAEIKDLDLKISNSKLKSFMKWFEK